HAVEAEVLERAQRDRLARAGHAADDDQQGRGGGVHVARSRKWLWRAMNAAAGSTPLARRMCTRAAASVSTARLRPAITGMVIVGTSRSSTRREPLSPVRRSMPPGTGSAIGLVRCTIRRRYLF